MDYDAFLGAGADVSRETFDDLCRYVALLRKWTPRINLVSKATLPNLWDRHILDSVQLFHLAPRPPNLWLDLGSGGGLPGAVVAILLKDTATSFVFLEADQRKATFLRTVIRELGLSARVLSERIERADPVAADVISARALAPLDQLLSFQNRHGAAMCTGLYLKGATVPAEIEAALESWRFSCDKINSATSADSYVLKIGDLHRA